MPLSRPFFRNLNELLTTNTLEKAIAAAHMGSRPSIDGRPKGRPYV